MKNLWFGRLKLATFFLLSLTTGQFALASEKDFVLKTSDHGEVGQGNYEDMPYSKAKVIVNLNNSEYVGTGQVNKSPSREFAYAMRSNRGTLSTNLKKQVSLDLVSSEDKKLTCELNVLYSKLWGHCIDSANQQTFLVKSSGS